MSTRVLSVGDVPQLVDVKQSVDSFLDVFCRRQIDRAAAISPAYGQLWEVMHEYFMAGGKRVRPYMALLAYSACGGDSNDDMLPAAVAWELLHGCMLIHDDIIDRDYLRHGHPNVAGHYRKTYQQSVDALHYADSTALIAGDLALSAAYQVVMTSRLEATTKQLIGQLLEAATFAVAGGELLDVQASLKAPEAADAVTIARYKTAEYSFCGPLLSGAMAAGAGEEVQETLGEFGLALGIAYQLVDDVLGLTGDEHTTGKSVESDVREGKRTVLLQQAYQLSDASTKRELTRLLARGRQMSDEDVKTVRHFIEASGAPEAVRVRINAYEHQTRTMITRLPFDEAHKHAFESLIDLALHRAA